MGRGEDAEAPNLCDSESEDEDQVTHSAALAVWHNTLHTAHCCSELLPCTATVHYSSQCCTGTTLHYTLHTAHCTLHTASLLHWYYTTPCTLDIAALHCCTTQHIARRTPKAQHYCTGSTLNTAVLHCCTAALLHWHYTTHCTLHTVLLHYCTAAAAGDGGADQAG